MNWTEFELLTKEQLYAMVMELEDHIKALEIQLDTRLWADIEW